MSSREQQAVRERGNPEIPGPELGEEAHLEGGRKGEKPENKKKERDGGKPDNKKRERIRLPWWSTEARVRKRRSVLPPKDAFVVPGVTTKLQELESHDFLPSRNKHDSQEKEAYMKMVEQNRVAKRLALTLANEIKRSRVPQIPIGNATIYEIATTVLNPCNNEKLDRVRQATAVVNMVNPRMAKAMVYLLDLFQNMIHVLYVDKTPLSHFCREQVRLWSFNVNERTRERKITAIDFQDAVSCLYDLVSLVGERDSTTATEVAENFYMFSVIIYDYATNLSAESGLLPFDYYLISKTVLQTFVESARKPSAKTPDINFIPKLKDFKIEQLIGAGGFGAVYKVRCLVNYYCVFSVDKGTVIMMEYIKGVDLNKVVEANRAMTVRQSRVIFAQVVSAIIYLHLMGIVHRDIKANNCLISADGKVKVIDFDTAKVCIGHYPLKPIKTFFKLTALEFKRREHAGTLPYMAPEILLGWPFGRATDFWSLGILLFKVAMGFTPFRGSSDAKLKEAVCAAKPPFMKRVKLPEFSADLKDMILQLLRKHARRRLGSRSYTQVLGHPFMKRIDWDELQRTDEPLRNLPGYEKVIKKASRYVTEDGTVAYRSLSPRASSRTRARDNLMKLDGLKADPRKERGVYIYVSPGFRALHVKKKAKKCTGKIKSAQLVPVITMDNPHQAVDKFRHNIDGTPRDESESIEVVIFNQRREEKLFKANALGFTVESLQDSRKNKLLLVTKIQSRSPASNSTLIVGDIITAIDGEPVEQISWWKVLLLTKMCGKDSVFLTVMVSNPLRMLRTHQEVPLLSSYGVLGLELPVSPLRNHMEVRRIGCYLAAWSVTAATWVFWKAAPQLGVYFGDVLLEVNGKWIQTSREADLNQILQTKKMVTVLIIPCSCLRADRLRFDRLLRAWNEKVKRPKPPKFPACLRSRKPDVSEFENTDRTHEPGTAIEETVVNESQAPSETRRIQETQRTGVTETVDTIATLTLLYKG